MNYNDDFRGVEASYDEAVVAFTHLGQLFTNLDLESSPTKDCLPSTRMIFLGLTYETVVVTLEKLHQTSQLLCYWLSWHDRTENECTVSTSRCPIQSLRKLF